MPLSVIDDELLPVDAKRNFVFCLPVARGKIVIFSLSFKISFNRDAVYILFDYYEYLFLS